MTELNLTKEDLKQMSKDTDCLNAVKKLLEAKAEKEVVKPKVHEIQEKVLKENDFYPEHDFGRSINKNEPIRNRENAFLMSDHQYAQFYDKIYQEYIKIGFDVEYEKCPLLIVENNVREAKENLVNVCEKYTGFSRKDFSRIDLLDKYINILLSFLTQFVKKKK